MIRGKRCDWRYVLLWNLPTFFTNNCVAHGNNSSHRLGSNKNSRVPLGIIRICSDQLDRVLTWCQNFFPCKHRGKSIKHETIKTFGTFGRRPTRALILSICSAPVVLVQITIPAGVLDLCAWILVCPIIIAIDCTNRDSCFVRF